jgi:hypothetical protein
MGSRFVDAVWKVHACLGAVWLGYRTLPPQYKVRLLMGGEITVGAAVSVFSACSVLAIIDCAPLGELTMTQREKLFAAGAILFACWSWFVTLDWKMLLLVVVPPVLVLTFLVRRDRARARQAGYQSGSWGPWR